MDDFVTKIPPAVRILLTAALLRAKLRGTLLRVGSQNRELNNPRGKYGACTA